MEYSTDIVSDWLAIVWINRVLFLMIFGVPYVFLIVLVQMEIGFNGQNELVGRSSKIL